MPTLPIQQQLLQDAFKYARTLQELYRRATDDPISDSDGSSALQSRLSLGSDSDNLDDNSSGVSSSLSSISSLSSEPLDDDTAAGYQADSDNDLSTDTEKDRLFIERLAALQEWIDYLSNTHVLFPNHVHKLSQLYLVLVLYKEDDHKQFRQNLCVNPETFDKLIKRIEGDPIFVSDRPQN